MVRADALRYLAGPPQPFNLVFLDPPFDSPLLERAALVLAARGWLAAGARVYVECPARGGPPTVPASWQPLKAKQSGEVGYHLFAHAPSQQVA